jgi:hypothetical protein
MNYARSELAPVGNANSGQTASPTKLWWESGWFWLIVAMASTIPLWWPTIPPLVDLPGHLGRYRVELELSTSESLQRYFSFHWALIGNLGVDLLIIPLAPIFGLEGAVKLIVMTIPLLTVGGIYFLSKEVHGRIPPLALFAVPFAYNFPFNFGFVNFALSMALALLGLAAWLRLSQPRYRGWLRAIIFVPLSCAIWIVHAYGWGMLALTVWAVEFVRRRDTDPRVFGAGIRASVDCLPLSMPLIFTFLWRSGTEGHETIGYFGFAQKAYSLAAALRDRWLFWDTLTVAAVVVLIVATIFDKRFELSRKLTLAAGLLGVVFILMPSKVLGSAFADMRLVPFVLILFVSAARIRNLDVRQQRILAMLGIGLIVLRFASTTVSYSITDREMSRHLEALDLIPQNARVLSVVGAGCNNEWNMEHHWHVGSLVIERKRGFSNDQWRLPGTQLLHINYPAAGEFEVDPSEVALSKECLVRRLHDIRNDRLKPRWMSVFRPEIQKPGRSADAVLREFPRQAFDYVWVVKAPDFDMQAKPGLVPIWRSSNSVLYRIDRSNPADEGVRL